MTPNGGAKQPPGTLAARLNRIKEKSSPPAEPNRQTGDRRSETNKPVVLPAGWEQKSEFVWRRCYSVEAAVPPRFASSPLFPKGGECEELVFFDTETTGLSGGAGTHVFLAGFGTVRSGKLTVEQIFLSDYPGEPEFLDLIQQRIGPDVTLVSYNGKAFDTQILRTRFIMNGLTLLMGAQLDLLYPARRLWKDAVPSCSLGTIEEYILNIRRENDIPGVMVPDIYFSFLKSGDEPQLGGVFSHHLQDIVSLERLLTRIAGILSGELIDQAADKSRLGRWLLDTGFPEGRCILSEAFLSGDTQAGYQLGRYLKRAGSYEEAAVVWSTMYRRDFDLRAAFELAKYTEHKTRDFLSAEAYATAILTSVKKGATVTGIEPIHRLEHRISRSQRKAQR